MLLLRIIALFLFGCLELVTASIFLSVEPLIFPCGDTITVTYSYTVTPTLPLYFYLKGNLAFTYSKKWELPNPVGPNVQTTHEIVTSECGASLL